MKKLIYSLAIAGCVSILAANVNAQCSSCGGGGGYDIASCEGGGFAGGGTGIPDNADETGIGTCTDRDKWPCRGNCEFTNGNWNAPCPTLPNHAYNKYIARGWALSQDKFTPYPLYTYGKTGIDAARIDQWNRIRAQQTSWHGGYNYWRYNAPTALVVPPTAAFQSVYSWGVGGTKSVPINHQFGANNPGGAGGISQQFSQAPYWPSSTDQLGVYAVRAPWSHIR